MCSLKGTIIRFRRWIQIDETSVFTSKLKGSGFTSYVLSLLKETKQDTDTPNTYLRLSWCWMLLVTTGYDACWQELPSWHKVLVKLYFSPSQCIFWDCASSNNFLHTDYRNRGGAWHLEKICLATKIIYVYICYIMELVVILM